MHGRKWTTCPRCREYIYLHHANRIFGVDSSATFDNKTIYHTSCILKQLLQWHCKIPNWEHSCYRLHIYLDVLIFGMNECWILKASTLVYCDDLNQFLSLMPAKNMFLDLIIEFISLLIRNIHFTYKSMVVLLYSDISNFTFWNVKNLKCKNYLIDFPDELSNFKQKKIYISKYNFFFTF